MSADRWHMDDGECLTCAEDPNHAVFPLNECPKSFRPCGHHCNCSWTQDACHWCRGRYEDDGGTFTIPEQEPAVVAAGEPEAPGPTR